MALDREQVGLLFKLKADTSDATQALTQFKGTINNSIATMRSGIDDASRSILSSTGSMGSSIADLSAGLTGWAATAGVSFAAVAAGMVQLSLKTAEYAGQIKDLSDKTNLTTDTLQSLRLAATLSGQSFESISQTAVIFQRRMEEARTKGGELAETFKALGVNLSGPVDQAFRTTLERLSGVEDGAQKTATTVELFGRSGSDLLPVIGQLNGSFQNLENRARQLGIVLSKDAIEKADEFGDQLDILKLQIGGVANEIGAFLLPALSGFVTTGGLAVTVLKNIATQAEGTRASVMRLMAAVVALMNPSTSGLAGQIAAGGGSSRGFQGPGLDENTGLPLTRLPDRTGAGAGRGGGGGRTAKEPTVRLPIQDFDRMTADYFERLNKLADDSLKKLDQARERTAATQEAILKEIEQREIDSIKAQVDQRVISEEEGAARVAAVRVAAFARTEDALKAQLDQQTADLAAAQAEATANQYNLTLGPVLAAKAAQLDAERNLTVQKLTQLQEERASIELEGNRQIEAARDADLQNLLRNAEEQKRIYQEIEKARRQFLSVDSLAAGIFGNAFSDALRRTGSELAAFQAVMAGFVTQTRQALSELPSLAEAGFGAMIEGATAMAEAFVLTGQTGPAAMRQLAAGVLGAIAKMAAQKAILNLALGIENLALAIMGVPNAGAAAAKHFIAAGIYGAIALATGAGARAVAPAGAGGGNTGGSGGTSDRDKRIIEQGGPLRGSQQPQIIIIRAETEPGVVVRKVVEDYRSNGASRQVLRRDMLGEG